MSTSTEASNTPTGRALTWLADAPLFIDDKQVAALYDAVLKPEYANSSIKLSLSKLKGMSVKGELGGEVEVGFADWLKTILPFLDAKAKASATVGADGKTETTQENEIELHPIETPQRQLVQLALHYLSNIPGRVRIVEVFSEKEWLEPDFVSALPRGLVFVEFPPQTKFVPMAAELADGKVKTIYDALVRAFGGPKISAPQYPEPAYYINRPDELASARKKYWEFFNEQFSSSLAMEAIEEISQGGLLRWIDYRVPLGVDMPYLHLHIRGNANYDTGSFAYQLVKRGFKHGLRMVGTMKSEPAMNVLAIFER